MTEVVRFLSRTAAWWLPEVKAEAAKDEEVRGCQIHSDSWKLEFWWWAHKAIFR